MPFDGTDFKTNTVADVLRRARALLGDPANWSKGTAGPGLCVLGALYVAAGRPGDDSHLSTSRLFAEANNMRGGCDVFRWNDDTRTTHDDIMAGFDKAILLAEQE